MFEKGKQPSPARQRQLDRYARLVDSLSPKSKMGQGLIRAFWVGGVICVIGQCCIEAGLAWLNMTPSTASTFASMMLVFLTALLTGLGVFDKSDSTRARGRSCPSAALRTPWYPPPWSSGVKAWCWGWARSCSPLPGRCWCGAQARQCWSASCTHYSRGKGGFTWLNA